MTTREALLKIDLRLNKVATSDYKNIKQYQKLEAINKAILTWIRRNKHGNNLYKEGNEVSLRRVDDLQFLLKEKEVASYKRDVYNEVKTLPTDYLYLERVTPYVNKGECINVMIGSSLREDANTDSLLLDWTEQPSFDFEQTFHTLQGNRIKVFHNKDFEVNKIFLTYYRKPKKITNTNPDVLWEIKDDLAEIIVDEAVKILAGDIQDPNTYETASNSVEQNN